MKCVEMETIEFAKEHSIDSAAGNFTVFAVHVIRSHERSRGRRSQNWLSETYYQETSIVDSLLHYVQSFSNNSRVGYHCRGSSIQTLTESAHTREVRGGRSQP